MLRAALVHEMAHCYESRMAIAHPEHAQLVNPALRASFAGVERWELVKTLSKAILWREILADFAMVSYLSTYHGERGVALAKHVTRVRLSNASRDPGHATGPYLQQVDLAHLQAGPLFEQALVTRNSLAVE